MNISKKTVEIAIVVLILVATGIVFEIVFLKKAQAPVAPVAQSPQVQSASQVQQTQVAQQQQASSQIPASWKTYTSDLSGLSDNFAGKKISFNYPAEWGEVKAEKTAEGTAFDGPGEKTHDIWNISFSAGPQDKNNSYLSSAIKIVDAQKYSAPKDIAFLQKLVASNLPVGDSDLKALNALGHGYGSTVFFGVNSARKYIPKNISTSDQQTKGLTFFMQDNQGYGTDLSYNAVLLDQKSALIVGGQFFLISKQQDQLENELNVINNDGLDKKGLTALDAWFKKWETFINSSYTSNPDYMTQVKEIDLVMQSLKIQ